jgi:hypothetical protein
MADERPQHEEREKLPLSKAAQHLLEECRMVLPGVQALFGFQLIAVFHPSFHERLSAAERYAHLCATALVVIAIILIMAPAAYHRQVGTHEVTETFLRLSTRLLLLGMMPLAIALCLEFYLVSQIIADGWLSRIAATAVFAFVVVAWFVLPRSRSLQRLLS